MSKVSNVHLSLGSNLGDRYQNLLDALAALSNKVGTVKLISRTYENPPNGFEADQDFLNLCTEVYTRLSPQELLLAIKDIEKELGRSKSDTEGYTSRPIDIDIIFYDELILTSRDLTIPHPHFRKRMFVLAPLCDIASDKIDPETLLPVEQLFNICTDQSIMRIYKR